MKFYNVSLLILGILTMASCVSDTGYSGLGGMDKKTEKEYNEALKNFKKHEQEKIRQLNDQLVLLSNDMSDVTMSSFLLDRSVKPVQTGIVLSITNQLDPSKDIDVNTFIHTVPNFDPNSYMIFKSMLLLDDPEAYFQMDFNRSVDSVAYKCKHDKDLDKLITKAELDFNSPDHEVPAYQIPLLKNADIYTDARYIILIKHVLTRAPELVSLGTSKVGSLIAGIQVYDRESKTVVSNFCIEALNTETYISQVSFDEDTDANKTYLSSLWNNVLSEFKKVLIEELSKRFILKGDFPDFLHFS